MTADDDKKASDGHNEKNCEQQQNVGINIDKTVKSKTKHEMTQNAVKSQDERKTQINADQNCINTNDVNQPEDKQDKPQLTVLYEKGCNLPTDILKNEGNANTALSENVNLIANNVNVETEVIFTNPHCLVEQNKPQTSPELSHKDKVQTAVTEQGDHRKNKVNKKSTGKSTNQHKGNEVGQKKTDTKVVKKATAEIKVSPKRPEAICIEEINQHSSDVETFHISDLSGSNINIFKGMITKGNLFNDMEIQKIFEDEPSDLFHNFGDDEILQYVEDLTRSSEEDDIPSLIEGEKETPSIFTTRKITSSTARKPAMVIKHVTPLFRLTGHGSLTSLNKPYWNILSHQLSADSPDFTQPILLLKEMKQSLLLITFPRHREIRFEILHVLSFDEVKENLDEGILKFRDYVKFVLFAMERLCIPKRKDDVTQLTDVSDTIELCKGIIELLEVMKIDAAKYNKLLADPEPSLPSSTPLTVMEKNAEVKEQAERATDYSSDEDNGNLCCTKNWLLRNVVDESDSLQNPKENTFSETGSTTSKIENVLAKAYIELLEWEANKPFPETLQQDKEKYIEISSYISQMSVTGSILLLAQNYAKPLHNNQEFEQNLIEQVAKLLQKAPKNKDLKEILQNVSVEVVKIVKANLKLRGFKMLDENDAELFQDHILAVAKPQHSIKEVIRKRICRFLQSSMEYPLPIPCFILPDLTVMHSDLALLKDKFLKLTSNNLKIYGDCYTDIVRTAMSTT